MKAFARSPWRFLLLAYAWTWLWSIPVILTGQDYRSSPLLLLVVFIAVFGPGLAGIIMTYREGNQERRRDFWRRASDFRRIRLGWVAFMLVLWPALHILANSLSTAWGNEPPASEMVRQVTSQSLLIPVIIVLYFFQAGIEDLGWRGYMLEKALQSWSPVKASLIVGVFHAFWHVPFFLIVGTNQIKMGFDFDFLLFVAQASAFSFYATWCYLDNRHSTLAAILLHTVGNLCNDIFTLPAGTMKFQLYTLIMVIGALVISLVWLKRKMMMDMDSSQVGPGKPVRAG
jgi:membrane protease YdiL (CAAX protease family)